MILLPAPRLQTDLINSALSIPLSSLTHQHRGRKLRIVGQCVHSLLGTSSLSHSPPIRVLAFDPTSSLLLISSGPSLTGNAATLLVDLRLVLLARSPFLKHIPRPERVFAFPLTKLEPREPDDDEQEIHAKRVLVNREKVGLDRGEYIVVVGWLEGDPGTILQKIALPDNLHPPLPIILEAIHLAQSLPPPPGALYRGSTSSWDGERKEIDVETLTADGTSPPKSRSRTSRKVIDVMDSDDEATPQPSRYHRNR